MRPLGIPAPDRLAIALLGLLAVAVVGLHAAAYPQVSPIDEFQHIDYLLKASRFDLVELDERVGEPAMREESCRGLGYAWELPPCDADVLDPAMYQEGGVSTAASHPPTYYLVTGMTGRVLTLLPGLKSTVTAARLLGGVWLAVGLGMGYIAAVRLGAPRSAAAAAMAAVAATPMVVAQSATVTPDGTAFAAGSGVLLAGLVWLRRPDRIRLAILGVAGLVAGGLKATNGLAVLAVGMYLVMGAGQRDDPDAPTARERLVAAAVLLGSCVLAVFAWNTISALMSTVDARDLAMTQRFYVDSLGVGAVLDQWDSLVTPIETLPPAGFFHTPWPRNLVFALGVLLVGGVLLAALIPDERNPTVAPMATATAVTTVIGGPLFVIAAFTSLHVYFGVPARYGLSLLAPAAAVTAATLGRWPRTRMLLGVCSALVVISTLFSMATYLQVTD